MRRILARLDDLSASVERLLTLALLAAMSLLVFLDVVHRVASSPEGPLSSRFGHTGGFVLARLITFAVCYGAFASARGANLSRGRTAAYAAASTIGLDLSVRLLLVVMPNGLVWSQPLALGMLLWVSLFGATLAAKERAHIVVEVAERLWPLEAKKYVKCVSGLVTAAFCFALVALGAHYTWDFVEQWKEGVGYVSGVRLPKWVVYAAIPACFTLMGLRFAAYAIGGLSAKPQLGEEVKA